MEDKELIAVNKEMEARLPNIEIINPDGLPDELLAALIADVEKEKNRKVQKAEFHQIGEHDISEKYWWVPVDFERIRRITGYLVGTLSRFNDAKRAEVRDRVKHGV